VAPSVESDRHSLDRLNAINDLFIKDKGFQCHGGRGINFTIPQR